MFKWFPWPSTWHASSGGRSLIWSRFSNFSTFLSSLKYLISDTRFLEEHVLAQLQRERCWHYIYSFPFFFSFLAQSAKSKVLMQCYRRFYLFWKTIAGDAACQLITKPPHLSPFAEGSRMACSCAWKPCRAAREWWWGCRVCVLLLRACCFGHMCLGEVWPCAWVCSSELQASQKCCSPGSPELWLKCGVLRYSVYVSCWVRLQSS